MPGFSEKKSYQPPLRPEKKKKGTEVPTIDLSQEERDRRSSYERREVMSPSDQSRAQSEIQELIDELVAREEIPGIAQAFFENIVLRNKRDHHLVAVAAEKLSIPPLLRDSFKDRWVVKGVLTDQGQMSVMYDAYDLRLRQDVLMKIVFQTVDDPIKDRSLKRIKTEAETLASIQSMYLPRVYDAAFTEDGVWFSMEKIPGDNLAKKDGGLSTDEKFTAISSVAQGLLALHQKGIIHNDVKPANIVHSEQDKIYKLVDLGVLSFEQEEVSGKNKLYGTAAYFSPEKVRGDQMTGKSDIWALGVTAYELYAGRLPFEDKGESNQAIAELFNEIQNSQPIPPKDINPNIPDEVNDFILKMLDKDPKKRPDAKEVAEFFGEKDEDVL